MMHVNMFIMLKELLVQTADKITIASMTPTVQANLLVNRITPFTY